MLVGSFENWVEAIHLARWAAYADAACHVGGCGDACLDCRLATGSWSRLENPTAHSSFAPPHPAPLTPVDTACASRRRGPGAGAVLLATLQPDFGGPENTPKFQFLGYVLGRRTLRDTRSTRGSRTCS